MSVIRIVFRGRQVLTGSLLLKLLDGSLVYATAFIDEMTWVALDYGP